jgi:hypothetical protein
MKLKGMETIPGWLIGIGAFAGFNPYRAHISGLSKINETEAKMPTRMELMMP